MTSAHCVIPTEANYIIKLHTSKTHGLYKRLVQVVTDTLMIYAVMYRTTN